MKPWVIQHQSGATVGQRFTTVEDAYAYLDAHGMGEGWVVVPARTVGKVKAAREMAERKSA